MKQEGFYNLNNKEKVLLLTSEDEDGYSILTLALINSLNALAVLLNSKAFFVLSEDQCLTILKALLNSVISKTSKEIHVLLDSRMVQKLSADSLYSFLIQNEDGELPLNQAIKASPENMRTLLDSVALEKLDSNQSPLGLIVDSNNALMCFIKDNGLGGPAMTMSKIKHNPQKLIGFITSQAFQKLDHEQQIGLVGEKLLTKVQACLLPEKNHLSYYNYNVTCVGEAIQEID